MKRFTRIASIILLASAFSGCGSFADWRNRNKTVVCDRTIGENACGPCSVLNSLKFGGWSERIAVSKIKGSSDHDRVETIIKSYGLVSSEAYPERYRYVASQGMCNVELLGMMNDVLSNAGLDGVQGSFFDRNKTESAVTHLHRVHAQMRRSLDLGFPPIVLIRSFASKSFPTTKKNGRETFNWVGLSGHWVSVVALPKTLPSDAVSFNMDVADSCSGKVLDCFVHAEMFRNFMAVKGDDLTYEWTKEPFPFLITTLPGISLKTDEVPWFVRSNVVLNYGVYRERMPLLQLRRTTKN